MHHSISFSHLIWKRLYTMLLLMLVIVLTSCGPAGTQPPETEPDTPVATEHDTPATEPDLPTMIDKVIPLLCDPARPDLTPLQGNVERLDVSEYGPEFVSYRAVYQNKNGQKFQLTASSLPGKDGTDNAQLFLESLMVCFEALEVKDTADYINLNAPDADFEGERKARADILLQQPFNVDVLMEWLSQGMELESKNLWVIHFVIDPTIDSDDGVDGFRPKCSTSAKVQVDLTGYTLVATTASVTGTLYVGGSFYGSTSPNASSSSRLSGAVRHGDGKTYRTYDAKVSGTRSQTYNIYGSWTENNSNISSSVCP